jgi:hypothetical protein
MLRNTNESYKGQRTMQEEEEITEIRITKVLNKWPAV